MMIFVVVHLSMRFWVSSMFLPVWITGFGLKLNTGKRQEKCMLHYQTLTVHAFLEVISDKPFKVKLQYVMLDSIDIKAYVKREHPCLSRDHLCLLPSKLPTLNKQFREACKLVFPKDRTGVKNRRNEVTAFLQAVEQYDGDNYEEHDDDEDENDDDDDDDNKDDGDNENGEDGEDREDEDEEASQALVHAPVHDAESIFWLIVLFFLRACPKDYNPKSDPRERKRRQWRTDAFESLVKKQNWDNSRFQRHARYESAPSSTALLRRYVRSFR
jgi:hypothetical protein